MASISTESSSGRRAIQFVSSDGSRKSIRLGKVPKKFAEHFKTRIEHLMAASETGSPFDRELSRWISDLSDAMHDKLARTGLVPGRSRATLRAFVDDYISMRQSTDAKPATIVVWGHTRRNLIEHFGTDKPLREITAGDAEEWRLSLVGQGLAESTIRKRCSFAKQFFNHAVKKAVIDRNPFADLKSAAKSNPDRFHFVHRETMDRVLQACPDAEWRLIVSLARFGGLRCPSEIFPLRWSDIDWQAGRIRVTSPKTEHHEGKESRDIPLFPELIEPLKAVQDENPESKFVISRYQGHANLGTSFKRIIRRAGSEPWPKVFQNLRSTRQTELEEDFPSHVVCAWMGNSEAIAKKHYLQVTDEHFEKASGAESGAPLVQNPVQHSTALIRTGSRQLPELSAEQVVMRAGASRYQTMQNSSVEDRGLEPLTFWLPAKRSPS